MHYLLHIVHILYTRVNKRICLFPKPQGNMRLIPNMYLVYNERQKLTTPKTMVLWCNFSVVDLVFIVESPKSVSCDAMTNVSSCLDENS